MRHTVLKASVDRAEPNVHAAFEWARRQLKTRLGPEEYRSWIEPVRLVGVCERAPVAVTPSTLVRDWVQLHAAHLWDAYLGDRVETLAPLVVVAEPELPEQARGLIDPADNVTPFRGESAEAPAAPAANPQLGFDSFCVNAANRAACTLMKDIAGGAAKDFPLVLLHGPPGVGKTHLMVAASQDAVSRTPGRRVRYMMAQIFIDEFQAALAKRRDMGGFKALVRENDLFLLDDVHRIAGKRATEEEFMDTIAVVLGAGGQVVVSADHGPQGLAGFDERLRTQLKGATDIAVPPPDFELRRAIVEMRVKLYRQSNPEFDVPGAVMDLIAGRIVASGRELDGAVRQLLVASRNGAEITPASAEQLLRAKFAEPEKRPTVDLIIKTTARYYGLTLQEILTRSRQKALCRPRQVAMYLCCKLTVRSLPDLGRRFMGAEQRKFDHSTVLYARDRIAELIKEDATLEHDVEMIIRAIREQL